MADTVVSCPECMTRLKVTDPSRTAVRCPRCSATVPVRQSQAAADEDDEPVRKAPARPSRARDEVDEPRPRRRPLGEDEDDEEDRPRRRRPRDEEDDEEDAPRPSRRRARVEDDEDDEDDDADDRPRRKKKKKRSRKDDTPGPWALALGACAGMVVIGFLMGLLIFQTRGLPESSDGNPGSKYIGLGVMVLVSLVLALLGINGVKNRELTGKWGITYSGGTAVAIGFVQAGMSGFLLGFAAYGLIF